LAIVGAGAAGLAAAIFAAEAAQQAGKAIRIALLEGARKPGAKILVSGGGRCNVTHRTVTPEDFFGGSRHVVRRVMAAFDEQATVRWFESLGVRLKEEPTGKLFPVDDSARSVLNALLDRARQLGVALCTECRVVEATPPDGEHGGWRIATSLGTLEARRLIMATGGRSLPKSGSDGAGLELVKQLGHTLVRQTPALVPLLLSAEGPAPGGRFAQWAGITMEARLELRQGNAQGKKLWSTEGSLLFTHFGLSGPCPLDFSRHLLRFRLEQPHAEHTVLLGFPQWPRWEDAQAWLTRRCAEHPRKLIVSLLGEPFPERMAFAMIEAVGLDPATARAVELPKAARQGLVALLAGMEIVIRGDRGYTFAETTAGGVPLAEIDPHTMSSRKVAAMHLCGEMLDVDGRIGGFNFQWAWATGYLAGRGAVEALLATP